MTKKKRRLINLLKTELGKISKNLIENIVSNILKNSNYNLWKNSYSIKWFKNINNKRKVTFIQFDIMDFYTSIRKKSYC